MRMYSGLIKSGCALVLYFEQYIMTSINFKWQGISDKNWFCISSRINELAARPSLWSFTEMSTLPLPQPGPAGAARPEGADGATRPWHPAPVLAVPQGLGWVAGRPPQGPHTVLSSVSCVTKTTAPQVYYFAYNKNGCMMYVQDEVHCNMLAKTQR